MSVVQLRTGGDALELLADAQRSVVAGGQVDLTGLSSHQLSELTAGLAEAQSSLAAWTLAAAAEADRRKIADETGDTDTAAWLAHLIAEPRELAAGSLWLAKQLNETYAATREALQQGVLRLDQARVIVAAGRRAPAGVTPEQLAEAERLLVAKATGVANRSGRPITAKRLRVVARRMFESISPELADEHEADQLERESDRAEQFTYFSLQDLGDGMWQGRFEVPELHARLLLSYLERLTAPRMQRFPSGDQPGATDETLISPASRSEQLGQGLLELIEHLPTEGHPALNSLALLVRIDHDKLIGDLTAAGVLPGAASLEAGVTISARDARRLACGAGIIPAVMGGNSEVLDLGRAKRLHSVAQRKALASRYDTCAIATCERPFSWTEVHHPHAWSRGGRTDLANALPLCGHHHRRAHDAKFELRRTQGEWMFHRRT